MTREGRARPYIPNGKPLGRHVDHSRRRKDRRTPPSPAGAVPSSAPENTKYEVAVRAVAVMAVSVGIVGTMALPSNAVDPSELHAGGLRTGAVRSIEPQSFVTSPSAHHADATRHEITATTMEELEAARAKQRAAELEFAAAKQRALDAAAAGLPVEQIAAASGADSVTPAEVPDGALAAASGSIVSVARQYLGVPYVFGGASPNGFDCSGLVLYVYAQFGVALPHSSLRQGANGTRVSDPVPGDLVVLDGGNHIGIYSGNGHMIDAPMPGRVVNERPIYTSNHFFVRY